MRNVVIFNSLSKVRSYQLKCALLLTSVPLICSISLTAILFFLAQQNVYFLEISGLIIDEQVRQAYRDQVLIELTSVLWLLALLFVFTFLLSLITMAWAVSPFVNAEKILRASLEDKDAIRDEAEWLSESPVFHKVIWGLTERLRDKNYPFDQIDEAQYHFSFRFALKFLTVFSIVSVITGYVSHIILNTMYVKVVGLALSVIRISKKGHYLLAQEELMNAGAYIITFLSFAIYLVIGYYLARYMSNMLFVFTRAIREHHFPLLLRDSDVYHGLADAISKVAKACGLERKYRD